MHFGLTHLILLVLFCVFMLVVGLYLLANFNRLFRRQIKNELLRKNLVVWLIAICLMMTSMPLSSPEFVTMAKAGRLLEFFLIQLIAVTGMVLFVFNITHFVTRLRIVKAASFRRRMFIIMCVIIGTTLIACFPVNYFANGGKFDKLEYSLIFNFYGSSIAGFIYVTMSYISLERERKLEEKELELLRLRELKTKAELDALHSKINPHFLYNALNSIADLSITDGRKGRKMTIALADLFRYSINYNDNNYSTVEQELEMAEVYLQIEKIRFEDKLNYSVQVDEAAKHYLIPRFLIQPIVENAVKHGLKATGKMTEILLEVNMDGGGLQINIADNGPAFPDDLVPGYGVKSLFDKLDLLFPGQYAIQFSNEPRKQVAVHINKLIKNEPVV